MERQQSVLTTTMKEVATYRVQFPFPVKQISESMVTMELPVVGQDMFSIALCETTKEAIGERDTEILLNELEQKYHELLLQRSLIITKQKD